MFKESLNKIVHRIDLSESEMADMMTEIFSGEITDAQISKLIGTTKTTIAAIRTREHWNIGNITPKDPVTLGLCSQRELDALVAAAAKKAGVQPVEDGRLRADRDAILAELRAERDAASADPDAAETPREHTADTLFRTQD